MTIFVRGFLFPFGRWNLSKSSLWQRDMLTAPIFCMGSMNIWFVRACSNLILVGLECLWLPLVEAIPLPNFSWDCEDLHPPLEMEGSMPSWGVAFGFWSLLEYECLNSVFDKEHIRQPLCSEWETWTPPLIEGTCSNLILVDLEYLGILCEERENLKPSS